MQKAQIFEKRVFHYFFIRFFTLYFFVFLPYYTSIILFSTKFTLTLP